jgi:hypothetical protein
MTLHEPSLSFSPTARVTETEARKALRHLDALTQPGWYDLALAGQPIESHAREQALQVVQMAEAVGRDQGLAWLELAPLCPGLFRSPAWLQARIHLELGRDPEAAIGLLQHALIAGALSQAQIVGLWVEIAETLTNSGQLETVARLGEALHATLPALEDVTRRTVEALVLLADDAEPGMRDGWLRRAQALLPDSEVIARRLELDAALRSDQRWRLLAAIACGAALVTAVVVALHLPV